MFDAALVWFYVLPQVVSRWWCQFTSLYWVDTLAMDLAAFLPGQGEAKMVNKKTNKKSKYQDNS